MKITKYKNMVHNFFFLKMIYLVLNNSYYYYIDKKEKLKIVLDEK